MLAMCHVNVLLQHTHLASDFLRAIGPPLVRPSRSAASAPALLGAAAGPAAVGAAASARWERASSAIPSGASPLVQLSGECLVCQVI